MVGAWCFVDHFGPTEQTDGMVVAAHPHTGLQTVTWLLEGAIEHRDSIGSIQHIHPGQLNLMTAGRGIAHSELSLRGPERLHAVQLWVALPSSALDVAPDFEHQANLPKVALHNSAAEVAGEATVLAGSFGGVAAPTKIFSPMMGAELRIEPNQTVRLPLAENFEHGLLLVEGGITVDGHPLNISALEFFEVGARQIELQTGAEPATLLLLGGEPFGERILMWWNFIGRTHEDIAQARREWNVRDGQSDEQLTAAGLTRFAEFDDLVGGWIPAPDLPSVRLNPR